MTLRQVLEVLWQRRLLVIASLVLVVGAALVYMQYSVKTYEAVAIVKLNGIATNSSDTDSTYAGIELETDIDAITSMPVIGPAARELGETDTAGLTASITAELIEGVRTNRINVRAIGASPAQAQARANAVASAYVDYLVGQVDIGKKRLLDRKAAISNEVRELQGQLDRDPESSVLQTYLDQAAVRLGQVQTQLDQLELAGKPAVVQKQATLGTSTSIGPATILAIGVLSGLLVGAGVALIREQFDDRLHSSKEIEEATGEPILAEVAVDRKRRKGDLGLPTATHQATAFNESIRTLRTSLQVLVPHSHSVVVITSPEPDDGKSFVTANLAVSMALAGRSVIVVGGDLRRGRIGQYFSTMTDARGFADAIASDAGATELHELLHTTEHDGLLLLPPGSTKAEPADLLASGALGHVIARLREMADIVLIDTPPALALADAAIIAGHADGVVVLSAVGRTRREVLVDTVRVLRANAVHVFGVVSNYSRRTMPKTYQGYLVASAGWEQPMPPLRWQGSASEGATEDAGTTLEEQESIDLQQGIVAEPVIEEANPEPAGEQVAVGVSPEPTGEQVAVGVSPEPTGEQVAVGVSPEPAGEQVAVGVSPEPTGEQVAVGVSPEPAGEQVAVGVSPEPAGEQVAVGVSPEPAGEQVADGASPEPAGEQMVDEAIQQLADGEQTSVADSAATEADQLPGVDRAEPDREPKVADELRAASVEVKSMGKEPAETPQQDGTEESWELYSFGFPPGSPPSTDNSQDGELDWSWGWRQDQESEFAQSSGTNGGDQKTVRARE